MKFTLNHWPISPTQSTAQAQQKVLMKHRLLIGISAIFIAFTINSPAQAQDIRDQLSIQTGKAELVIENMDPNKVASEIKEAISQFAIPVSLNFRLQPSEIPARPDQPLSKQVFVQGTPAVEYQCPTAYAEIVKSMPPIRNPLTFIKEYLQVCLYSFEKGTKVYLFYNRIRKTESLTGGLFSGITAAFQGTDGERIEKQLNENIAAIKKSIPTLLTERIEVPGMPLKEPDKAAVAALIPAKSVVQAQAVVAPIADAPNKLLQAPALNAQQTVIEARKNLTAMGMSYFSHEQFLEAIRRKDAMAVQLFVEADNIDLTKKDVSGKTPLEVANAVGALDVAALIAGKLAKKSASLQPIVQSVQKVEAVVAFSPQKSNSKASATDSVKELDSEDFAELNAGIDALSISAEKKEVMRENAIRQVRALKALFNRTDQKAVQLKQ